MEQLARAIDFNTNTLKSFLTGSIKDEVKLQDELSWNIAFFKQMKNQKLQEKGHVAEIQEILIELHYLHNTLTNIIKDQDYINKFESVQPLIKEFIEIADKNETSDVQAMIKALNAFLSLKISGKHISEQTKKAISSFSETLGILASRYKLMKKGELNLNLN